MPSTLELDGIVLDPSTEVLLGSGDGTSVGHIVITSVTVEYTVVVVSPFDNVFVKVNVVVLSDGPIPSD